MKKFLLTVVATLIGCFMAAAQTVGVAILTHGDELTAFYGNSALHQAVDAAVEGDVISLSPGVFKGFETNPLTKSGLTIIGSGMEEGPSRTTLTGFSLRANNNSEKFIKLTLKDVYVDYCIWADNGNYELSFSKCNVWQFNCGIAENETSTITLEDCISCETNGGTDNFSNCILTAYNCVLKPNLMEGDVSRSRILSNCILNVTPSENSHATITNCIILDGYQYCHLPSGVRATNCKAIVGTTFGGSFLGHQSFSNESFPADFEAFTEGTFYELKPELAATWVDEHGEQIGLYGGPAPFSMLPNAPRFTKFNVPPRTDEDGKLPVEIEVAFPEK